MSEIVFRKYRNLSMNESMSTIFKVEREAEELLKSAKEKAADILKKAEQEANLSLNNANLQVKEIIQSIVDTAQIKAEAEKKRKLEKAQKVTSEFIDTNSKSIEKLVNSIVELIHRTDTGES